MKNKNLYLIIPPLKDLVSGFSFGLNSIKNYLEQTLQDIDVTVKDFTLYDDKKVSDEIKDIPNDAFVGITTVTASYQSALKIAKKIKLKGNKIILGGAHASKQAEIILKSHDYIDYVAIGQGEKTLLDLVTNDPKHVSGLAYRSDKSIKINLENKLSSKELSQIRLRLDDDLIGKDTVTGKVERKLGESIIYSASRGCVKTCSFCAAAGIYSTKNLETIVGDLKYLKGQGYDRINFEDNFFGINTKKTKELCDLIISEKLDIAWDCQTRVEICEDREALEKMYLAGCDTVFLGVENLDQSILNYFNKTDNCKKYVEDVKKTIEQCYDIGINPQVMFQIGTEIENKDIRENNLKGLKNLGKIAKSKGKELDVYLMVSVAYPGTKLFEDYKSKNRLDDDIFEDFSRWEENNRDSFIKNNCPHGIGGIPLGIMDESKIKKGNFKIDQNKYNTMLIYYNSIRNVDGIKVYDIADYIV